MAYFLDRSWHDIKLMSRRTAARGRVSVIGPGAVRDGERQRPGRPPAYPARTAPGTPSPTTHELPVVASAPGVSVVAT